MPGRWIIPTSVLFRDLGGESVLLELESGIYFGLDAVGTRIWSLLHEHGQLDLVCEALVNEFEVEPEVALRDLRQLVAELVGRGLLIEDDGG